MGKTIFIPNSVSGGGGGAGNLVRIPVGIVDVQSATSLPAGAVVTKATLNVISPYPTGTTIQLGTPLSPGLFQASSENFPDVSNLYQKPLDLALSVAEVFKVSVSTYLGGGSAFASIEYFIPQS